MHSSLTKVQMEPLVAFPVKRSFFRLSAFLIFMFKLAWSARFRIPFTISFIFLALGTRVNININVE